MEGADPVLTIPLALGIGGFLLTLLTASLAVLKLMDRRDEKLHTTIDNKVQDRVRETDAINAKVEQHRHFMREEMARIDREVSNLKVMMATIPNRKEMDGIVKERVQPIEGKLDTLMMHMLSGGSIQKGSDQFKD